MNSDHSPVRWAPPLAALAAHLALIESPLWAMLVVLLLGGWAVAARRFAAVVLTVAACLGVQLGLGLERGPVLLLGGRELLAAVTLLTATLLLLLAMAPAGGGPSSTHLRRLPRGLWQLPLAVLLAAGLLTLLAEPVFVVNRFRFDPPVIRALALGWLLLAAVLLPGSLLALVRWRRLTPAQASLYLRTQLAEELPEQRLVERARAGMGSKLEQQEQKGGSDVAAGS